MRTQVKTNKLPKARENAGDKVVIGFSFELIGWESGKSFLDQSQSEKKQNQSNPGFDTQLKTSLITWCDSHCSHGQLVIHSNNITSITVTELCLNLH